MNCLVDVSAGKTELVSFDQSNNTSVLYVRIDESVVEWKSSFKMLGLCYIISIAKTVSKKIGALIHFLKFFSPEVASYLCKSTIYGLA